VVITSDATMNVKLVYLMDVTYLSAWRESMIGDGV
jgi:hypothetical protein